MWFILGLCPVSLTDLSNICNKTNGGSHFLPGKKVVLRCDVNFSSNGSYNVLTWTVPVNINGQSENVDISYTDNTESFQNESIYLSNANIKRDSAYSILTFITMQSLDDRVVTCKDSLGDFEDCTLLINSKFTFTVKLLVKWINIFTNAMHNLNFIIYLLHPCYSD